MQLASPLCAPPEHCQSPHSRGADSRISATLPWLSCPSPPEVLLARQGETVVTKLEDALAHSWV